VLSIAMLKEIMGRISPNEKVQPYELFDIICGTSTGGIIAVLLGAQRRSVAETEALYDEFIDKVNIFCTRALTLPLSLSPARCYRNMNAHH
jgi:patatin-like phospholipase/acyl hydrolase